MENFIEEYQDRLRKIRDLIESAKDYWENAPLECRVGFLDPLKFVAQEFSLPDFD
jgi:hypothetical protein